VINTDCVGRGDNKPDRLWKWWRLPRYRHLFNKWFKFHENAHGIKNSL